MDSPPPPDPVARQPEQYWAIGPLVQVNVKTCLLDDDLTAWVTLDLEPFEPHEITVAMEEEEEESPGYILMDGRLHAATAPPWRALSGPTTSSLRPRNPSHNSVKRQPKPGKDASRSTISVAVAIRNMTRTTAFSNMKRAFTESQPSIPPRPGRQDPPPFKIVHLVKFNVTIRLHEDTRTVWIARDDSPFSTYDVKENLPGYVLEDGRLASGGPPWRQDRRNNPLPLRSPPQFRIVSTEKPTNQLTDQAMTDNPADPPLNDQPPPTDPAAAAEDLLLSNNDIEMVDVSPEQEAEILGVDVTETSTEETQESTEKPSSVSTVHGVENGFQTDRSSEMNSDIQTSNAKTSIHEEENCFQKDRSSEMNPATPVVNETNSALEKITSLPEDRSLNSVDSHPIQTYVTSDSADPSDHPFAPHYTFVKNTPPSMNEHVRWIATQIDLAHVTFFRAKTEAASQIFTEGGGGRSGAPKTALTGITSKPSDWGVIYIIVESDGRGWYAKPHLLEVVANDRPDLHMVYFDVFADDLSNPGVVPHTSNYYPGDALYVTELVTRPKATVGEKLVSFDGIHSTKNHHFWKIKTCYLLHRTIQEDVVAVKVNSSKSRSGKVLCVAAGFNTLVTAKADMFKALDKTASAGTIVSAKIFCPKLKTGEFVWNLSDESRPYAADQTRDHASSIPTLPSVITLAATSTETQETMCHTVQPFKKFPSDIRKCYKALFDSAYLGLSGTLALANKNKDFQVHTVLIDRVLTVRNKPTISFVLTNLSGPAQISQWARSSVFLMKADGRNLQMEVDDASFVDNDLVIRAKLITSESEAVGTAYKMNRVRTIVWQEMENNEYHLKLFPVRRSLPDNGIPKLQSAVVGSMPRKPTNSLGIDSRITVSTSKMVGKTTMIAAALHITIRESAGNKMHLAMATTNAATAAIVLSYSKISNAATIIRMISAANYDHIDPQHRTSFDFPVVWPREFDKLLQRTDSDDQAPITEIVLDAYAHLRRVQTISLKLVRRKDLQNALKAVQKPIRTIFEILVQLINPRGIIGTISSVTDALRENGAMSQYGSRVATVQMDEASQIAIHSVIALGPLCPKARYALIGDIKQLKPYADIDSTKSSKSPQSETFRRCPFEVTATSSAMFYQNRLTSIRSPGERSRFLDLLAFNNGYPLQIIDTTRFAAQQTSGTSLFNPTEASIALAITSRVLAREEKASVGILTYYKAQAGYVARELDDTPAFVGTIDASQGQEFDLVIVLTSRSKSFHSSDRAGERNKAPDGAATADPDFIESPERLNVAMTRTKSLCLVLVDVAAAGRSKLWSNLFCKIPPGAFHKDPSHLMRHLQTLH
ncbi:hypothetical protein CRE_01461 [Caenorhabditis remanei]|uniref:DNA2/NAM7 helicase-like C-terminal domain-containing protein n=1 Tax=Caenorhabditis remanei TaxID=31234 RepID=E3NNZ9_CAERE|nr:hypothetical protein CRE_01461 [Caenorhabditis remanei]